MDAAWIAEGFSRCERWLCGVHAFFGGWLAHAGLVVDSRVVITSLIQWLVLYFMAVLK